MQPRGKPDSPDGAPNCVTPIEQKGGDGLERRPLVGIARERETCADDVEPCQRVPAPTGRFLLRAIRQ